MPAPRSFARYARRGKLCCPSDTTPSEGAMDTGRERSDRPLSDKEKVLAFCTPESEVAFSLAEYRERLERIKTRMAQAGIDTLFVSSPENMYYVSGFRANWYSAQGPRFWVG